MKKLIRLFYKLIRPNGAFPMKLSFTKENGTWYIDLPSYPGPKAALAMVAGADDLCDELSANGKVNISLNLEPNEGDHKLTLVEEAKGGGAYYTYNKWPERKTLWLCDVTLYVLGNFPEKLYFKNLNGAQHG